MFCYQNFATLEKDQDVIPGNNFKSTFLSSLPLPKFARVKARNTQEISKEVIRSLGGIFGLGFLLVLIAYKSSLMSSKKQQEQLWKIDFRKMFIQKKKEMCSL